MHVALFVFLTILFSLLPSYAYAQDARVVHLAARILEKLPDAAYTRDALGKSEERELRALEHAAAITNAADKYAPEWVAFADAAEWKEFNPPKDLPALLTAIAFKESSFRSVVRLDDNTLVKKAPRKGRADMGVLQVRAPSRPASECGVVKKGDTQRLIDDLSFAYMTGACILTKRVAAYVQRYRSPAFVRAYRSERLDVDSRFYSPRWRKKDPAHYALARELVVIERYNWGGHDLYLHPTHGSYARRIIKLFKFFRLPTTGDIDEVPSVQRSNALYGG